MLNTNRSKMQQNAGIGLDASSFKDRSVSMQPRPRRTSVHRRSSINYNSVADIRKLLNSTPRINKTRRYSVSLSGQKEANKQVTKIKRRKGRGATIITRAYNIELTTPVILEFPERDTTQKTDNNEDDSNNSNSDDDVNNKTNNKDVCNNSEIKMHTAQIKKNDVSKCNGSSIIKEEKTKRKKEKNSTNIKTSHFYKSIKGDKEDKKRGGKNKGGNEEINRLFIAELEELKIKTREEKIKFRKERERLEKLKETQHEKYQVQLILMEQEKLRKLKENKQRIKKLERAVIRAPGGDESKYNKKVININTNNGGSNLQSTSNKKKETFIFDKDVTTIADTVDPLETLNNNISLQREQEIKKQLHRKHKHHSKHKKHHHKTSMPTNTTNNNNNNTITSTSPTKEINSTNASNTLNDNINSINIPNVSSSIQTIPPSATSINPPSAMVQSISPIKNTKRMKPHKRNIPLKEAEDDSRTKRQTINFDKIIKEVKVKDPKEHTHRPSPSKFELKPHSHTLTFSHTRTFSSSHNRSHTNSNIFNNNINNISLNNDSNNRTLNDNYYTSNVPLTSRTHYSNSLQQYIQSNPDKKNTNNNSNKFKTHIKTKSTSLNTYNTNNNTFYNHKKDLNLSFSFINNNNNTNVHNHNNSLLNQSSNYAITNALNICITNQNLIDTSKQNQDNDELSMCFTDRIFYNPNTTDTHKSKIKSSLCKSNSNNNNNNNCICNTKDNSFNYGEYKDKASLLKRFHIRTDSMPIQEEIFHNERSQRSKSKSKNIKNSTTYKHTSTKSIEIFDNENDTSSIQNDIMPSSVKYIQSKKIILTNRLTKSKRKHHPHHQHTKSVLNSFLSNNISGINLSQCNSNTNNITDSITKCQYNSKTPTKCNEFLNICNSTTININNTNNSNSVNNSISCSNPYINTNITNTKTTTHSSTKTQPFVDKDFINNDNNVNNILKAHTARIHSSGNSSVVTIKKRNNKNVLSSMTTTNVKEPTLYEGMVDINCISAFGLRDTVNQLINKLKMYNVFYLQVNTYMFRCNQKKTSFDIEICQIYYKVYYYMLRIKTGGVNMKKDIIAKLFCD